MKKIFFLILTAFFLNASLTHLASAQEEENTGYNPNSVNPIHESNIMFKKRVWRRIDLKEKQNKSFYVGGNGVVKVIIDAVKNGILTPYVNDSLERRMAKEDFLKNLEMPDYGGGISQEEEALGLEDDSDWNWGEEEPAEETSEEEQTTTASAGGADYFLPSEITVLEIMEDLIFDRQRSRMYHDMLALKLVIPAEKFETGLIKVVATFKYKDLAELFRSMPKEAIWFNPQNDAEHKNLADAFALRLFSSRIIKIGNPGDLMVEDIYNRSPKEGLMGSMWEEHKLLEYESELWSY